MEVVKDAVDGEWIEREREMRRERKTRGGCLKSFRLILLTSNGGREREKRERKKYERKRGSVNFSLLLEPEFNQFIRRTSSRKAKSREKEEGREKEEESREKMGESQSPTLTTSSPDLMESG